MENTALRFLAKVSDMMAQEVNVSALTDSLKAILSEYKEIETLNVYVFDNISNTLRLCSRDWCIIPSEENIYKSFEDVKNHDFVINSKAYKLPALVGDITIKISSLCIPLIKQGIINGIMEIRFQNDTSVDTKFLYLMKIFSVQVSLKLQNILLSEQSKINVEFHDSMKNIAKIIETQYELNYIVPLIGEMLDRFISDHLIYIFLKQDGEYKLVWPKACNDERIYEALKEVSSDMDYLLTNNDKIGAFPLISEGEIIGCIVARSTLESLSKHDISYLEQLTRQSAITINRANAYSKVLQYATIDALTNLNNRRQFEIRLGQEIASAKRQNTPLCAMMTDIDFFKKVNDTYGHASGDSVLRGVASIIKEQLRESDIPSRYGGEEFAVLLPYTKIEEAAVVGERLRKAVEDADISINTDEKNPKQIKVTVSIGLAEFRHEESGEELFERADRALYESKKNGRNRVCID